jgi:hypothetical protein
MQAQVFTRGNLRVYLLLSAEFGGKGDRRLQQVARGK